MAMRSPTVLSSPAGLHGAVLLDKDGTLLENVPYNVDPVQMRLAPTAGDALRRLARLDMPLVVVSNQPGVALGRFGMEALHAVHRRLGRAVPDARRQAVRLLLLSASSRRYGARLCASLRLPQAGTGHAAPCRLRPWLRPAAVVDDRRHP